MQMLALIKDPNYSTTINLDNVQYRINVLWNERDSSWHIDFLTAQEEPIVSGMKICNTIDLFRLKYQAFPQGKHLVPILSTLNTSIKLKYDHIPNLLMLYYMDDSEYDSLLTALSEE